MYGRTDICFESFFVKKYSNNAEEDINFSVYIDFDKICVIVPKAMKIPKGLRLYYFFPRSVWICSILVQVFVYITWYFLQTFIPAKYDTHQNISDINYLCNVSEKTHSCFQNEKSKSLDNDLPIDLIKRRLPPKIAKHEC